MNARQAWIAGVGGVVGFAMILVGALWTMSDGACTRTEYKVYEPIDGWEPPLGPLECVENAADLTWLNPTLLIAGVVVLITAAVLAFSPWGRGEA